MKKHLRRIVAGIAGAATCLLLFAYGAAAQTEEFGPRLSVPIPGLQFSKIEVQKTTGEQGVSGYIDVPWIAQYINAIYRYGVAIAGVVAAVTMVIGGFQYMTGKPAEGKDRIRRSLLGVVMVFGAYVILTTINPDLVDLATLRIKTVAREEFSLPADFPEDTSPGESPTGAPAEVNQAAGTGTTTAKGKGIKGGIKFNSANAPSLIAAGDALFEATKDEEWGPGVIKGGGERSIEDQVKFYHNRCIAGMLPNTVTTEEGRDKCTVPTCGPYAPSSFVMDPPGHKGKWLRADAQIDPTRCPHNVSVAIDISCTKSSTPIKGVFIPCHLELEKAMKAQGFCRLKTEPWHFEKPKLSSNCDFNWTPGTYLEKAKHTPPNGVTHSYANCDGYYSFYDTKILDDNERCSKEPRQ